MSEVPHTIFGIMPGTPVRNKTEIGKIGTVTFYSGSGRYVVDVRQFNGDVEPELWHEDTMAHAPEPIDE